MVSEWFSRGSNCRSMPILNYTTKIAASQSLSEITAMLARRGASKIVLDYDHKGQVEGLAFAVEVASRPMYFTLPSNHAGVLAAMGKDAKVPASLRNEAQARAVAWRILKDWVAAQCAIIDAQLVVMEQVFLPYAVTRSGETLYEHIRSGKSNLLLPE